VANCCKGDESLPATAWEPDRAGAIRLGSFNRHEKIRGWTLRLWAKVLHALADPQLGLVDHAREASERHEHILALLADCCIESHRVLFLPPVAARDVARFLALYDIFGIALDTIPFNSGRTAFDALWMGVPLAALEGIRICGRMAATIARNQGHPAWAATSEDQYVSIVCTLARDVEGRKKLRNTLRASMLTSPVMDEDWPARWKMLFKQCTIAGNGRYEIG
jgi:protein O-GlcNAc transferase